MHADERADDRYRHGQDGNQRGPQRLQKHEHDEYDEHDRFEERVDDLLDRIQCEEARIERDAVVESGRKLRFQLVEPLAHRSRGCDGIRAGLLINRNRRRRLAVHPACNRIVLLVQLDSPDVLDPHDRGADFRRAHDDVLELFGLG